jgi:uncharacterized protein
MPDKVENNKLLVFAKLPEPGKVKTRLAEDLGDVRAAEIYSYIARDIISRVSKSSTYETVIYYDPPDKKNDVAIWLKDCAQTDSERLIPQEGSSLGERILGAFESIFSSGAMSAVIIGTDCTDVTAKMIEETFGELSEYDAVLGPAEDGGYYLLGLNCLRPELFQDIDWSTDIVLEQTLSRLNKLGLNYKLRETLRDIDNLNDLNSVSKDLELTKKN